MALSAAACGGGPAGTATPDAGTKPGLTRTLVDVDGVVELHPLEQRWREAEQKPAPSLAGTKLAIEDAARALAGLPALATVELQADGKFEVSGLDVTNVSLAVVATLTDPHTPAAFMTSGYGLVAGKPTEALHDKHVYVLTNDFIAKLQAALGTEAGKTLSSGGFVLGAAYDGALQGVEGAKFARSFSTGPQVRTDGVFYLNADLSAAAGDATSANGAFLFYPPVGSSDEYTMTKAGVAFEEHLVGSKAGAVLSSTFKVVP